MDQLLPRPRGRPGRVRGERRHRRAARRDRHAYAHVKTHRTPGLALRQLGGVADGVTCATLGEAEVMADAGIADVFIANEVVAPDKLARLAALAAGG